MDDPKIMNIMNGMKSLEDHCQLINDVKGKWPVDKKKKKNEQSANKNSTPDQVPKTQNPTASPEK